MEVKATVGTNVDDRTVSGVLPVQVNTASPFGAGWSLAGSQSLLIGSSGVAMIDNRTGGSRYFSGSGPSYSSPPNDQGTLVKNNDGTYTYTAKDQTKTNFDSTGRQTSQVDAHGLSQTFAYSSPISTITQPDGGVASFSYSGGLLSSVQLPGSRYLTLAYDGNSNLTGFQDAAGGLYTLSYDTAHRLVNEQVGPLNVTYSYSGNGTLMQINRGLGTTLSLTAAAAQGLGAGTAINASQAAAVLTDALGHITSYTLDALGRPLQVQTVDGTVQSWTRDAAGNPTLYVDQLGRMTSYAYNTSEDLTQVTYADGTITSYQYETTFHQVTRIQNALNQVTSFSYDGSTGDLLTQIDALGKVTSYTWSNGLKQTMTDALGRVTSYQWNGSRQLLAMTDAQGHITSYGYDGAGNQVTVQDALGHTTTSSYDGKRRLLTHTNALGGVASYAYDAIDNLLTSMDELSRTTSYGYDVRGLQVAMTEAVGTSVQRTTSSSYDAAANLLFSTDALGEITSYAYDALNRQVARIEAFGSSVQRAFTTVYDTVGNVLSSISPLAVTTSYGYDTLNRQIQRIDAYGTSLQRTWSTAYDAIGNVLSQTNPGGTVTSFGYDADNRRTKQIDAYGTSVQRTTSMAYDAVGNLLSLTNAVGAVTSYAYDALNRQVQRYDAFGSSLQRITSMSYDAVSNLLSVINPRGYTTSYGYDALNRRVLEIDALGTSVQRTLTTTYDAVSNRLSLTNGLGVVTSFSLDALNRMVAQLDGFGTSLQRAVTMLYDADDNVLARIDALGYATSYGYDALNRQITVQDAAGGIVTTAYDAEGNVVRVTDQLGHVTSYVYDALNRKTQTIDARGGIVTLAYDANSNLLSLIDPVGNQTQWLYDALDRKVQETDPLGNSGTYAYDAVDRQTSATDRNGQRIASSYDLLNRLTGENWYSSGGGQVGTLTFTYDGNDNLLTAAVSGAMGTMSYASTIGYDALDRRANEQSPFGVVQTYSYDAANNRTLMQDSFGGVTSHVYDVLNRLVTVLFGGSGQTPLREDQTYTPRDQEGSQTRYSDLAGTSKVGSSSFGYSAVQLLTNLQHFDGVGNSLASYVNSFDQARRITSEVLNGGAPTIYLYDATNQLTSDGVVSYSYDLNGNRTMAGYATGLANEVTSDGTWSYFYDRNGNRIVKRNPSTGEVWSYSYDNRNRLVSVQNVTTSGIQMQATYSYDALGQRIEKDLWTLASGSVTSRFAYDRRQIWAELTLSNGMQARWVRRDRVLEIVGRITSGAATWVLTNRIASVCNVLNSTGVLIDTISYDGYGNVASETNAAIGEAYKFGGYRSDSETGLYRPDLSTARYYDARTGRWLSSDPAAFSAGDSNLFRYTENNPVNYLDPSATTIYVFAWEGAGAQMGLSLDPLNTVVRDAVKKGAMKAGQELVYKYYFWYQQGKDDLKKAFENKKEGDKVVFIGYSWGGQTAVNVAFNGKLMFKPLVKVGEVPVAGWWTEIAQPRPVDLAFTIDPIGRPFPLRPIPKPVGALAKKWINYYQTSDTLTLVPIAMGIQIATVETKIATPLGEKTIKVPRGVQILTGLKGQKLNGAENVQVDDDDLKNAVLPDGTRGNPQYGHIFIPFTPKVLNRLRDEISKL